jgi:putative NADH-flavin reductase
MKIALFGASGNIGKRIGAEALERGHEVTALIRRTSRSENRRMHAVSADITNPDAVTKAITGHDVVINAVSPTGNGAGDQMLVQSAKSLLAALPRATIRRLIVVGGSGSLEVAPGQQLVDSPEFPAAGKSIALAHRDALQVYLANQDLDWTYVSPAAFIDAGQRTGKFRTGSDKLIVDGKGKSAISIEDFAVLIVDELEKPKAIRQRLTAAY